jgi:hypothetical protein
MFRLSRPHQSSGQQFSTLGVGTDHLLMLPRIAMMWLLAAVIGQGHDIGTPSKTVA